MLVTCGHVTESEERINAGLYQNVER